MSTQLPARFGKSVDYLANFLLMGGLLGFILGETHWMVAMIGLGLFSPCLLRESGLLAWRDDFQREATTRAGMHALMAVGLLVTVVMFIEGVGGRSTPEGSWNIKDNIPASFILLVLAITWILSRLLQFWGVIEGTRRFLITYCILAILALILVVIRQNDRENVLSSAQILSFLLRVASPGLLFLGVRRWPRIVGWLLLGTVISFMPHLVAIAQQKGDEPTWIHLIEEACALALPLLVSGLALISFRKS